MSNNRIILVIKASDIDVSSLPEDKRDLKSRAFKDAVYEHILKNYGVSGENIIVHIQNDIITIEWNPLEKDEYFDAEFQRSLRLLTDGKLEEARFILEDLAFQSPKDPNVLYNLGMVYSEFHELDIAIDTLERCVNIVPLYSNAYVALGVAYGRQGKLKEAAIFFTKALALDKNNSYAYRNLASILGKMGNNPDALKYLKLAYEIDAFDSHTLYGLGLAYQDMGDQVNATVFYKKLVELGTPQELVDLAKDSLRNIAVRSVKDKGFRADAMLYCQSALRAPKHKKESTTNRTFGGKQNTMYVQRVKIPLHGSAPVQRKKVVRYCEISCRVPDYRQPQPETICEPEVASVRCDIPTQDGSLGREMITGVVMVGMVANAFLCDRGRSLNVLPEVEPHPTRFRVNSFNQWDKGSGGITLKGKTKAMHYEMSDLRQEAASQIAETPLLPFGATLSWHASSAMNLFEAHETMWKYLEV